MTLEGASEPGRIRVVTREELSSIGNIEGDGATGRTGRRDGMKVNFD